jgi:hypothetical protein
MKNKLLLTILTFVTALAISGVAIYYSVAGLAAIFAAAVIPIVIMGGILEIAKLVTTVWLHRYWSQAKWWLKTYLSVSVIILMFITSMGIFGFLSKAHIEQTSASQESVASVERYDNEIQRQTGLVERYETRIKQLESGGGGADASIQSQIDTEQRRIDSAYARIQPQIDEQNRIIEGQSKLFSDQIIKIDSELAQLQQYIDSKQVDKAQALVGVKADGDWGPGTARAVTTWKTAKTAERVQLVNKIQDINRDNSNIQAAREEVKRLRAGVDVQVAESNKTIVRLRESLGKNKSEDIDSQLREQLSLLKEAQTALDVATKEKYKIQSEYRKLEAEVGPVKYIAEFVYGEEADKNMLERAVRWVIIIIIFVFDPLAVLLLLASQYSFEFHRRERKTLDELLKETPVDDRNAMNIRALDKEKELYVEIIGLKGEISDLTEELQTSEEAKNSFIKAYEDEVEVNNTLHNKLEQHEYFIKELENSRVDVFETNVKLKTELTDLEAELSKMAAERDRVFKDNIDLRIDCTDLEDALAHTTYERDQLLKTLSEEIEAAESPAPEPTVDSDVITASDSLPEPVPTDTTAPEDIKTYGVTSQAIFYHPSEEYVNFEGKQISINALKGLRPDLLLSPGDPINQILFGNTFPRYSKVSDIYIRTDAMPHLVYKFNGTKWIEVDKSQNTSYVQYIPYLQYLIQKCESGEYDTDYLTDAERDEIENHLSSK